MQLVAPVGAMHLCECAHLVLPMLEQPQQFNTTLMKAVKSVK
ncbi:hypothetical protein QR676_12430 [Vibrio sp. TMPB1044]|nr:hypothetical protein [Vibrio sp. TMPB1044]MDL5028043.1 hypothetical protein [Vibrio sp. TMPB1044]MDN5208171.1 hypothetical protein [Vibrio sp. TMPB1044]